jgi:hypothetical protein
MTENTTERPAPGSPEAIPYSFVFDEAKQVWICSVHGETDWTAWVRCFNDCDEDSIDEYEDDPINCSPGEFSVCSACNGNGGFTVCGPCNINNPDAEF